MPIAILIAALIAGCSAAQPSQSSAPAVSNIPGTPNAPPPTGDTEEEESVICDEVPVPVSLVLDNIATTDFSGLVRIDTVDVVGEDGGPPEKTGYVNHQYRVTVLQTTSGAPEQDFTFSVMADADIRPMEVGLHLFVSLCRGAENKYYSPDNGYVFEAPPSFMEGLTRALQTVRTDPAASVCHETGEDTDE